MQITRSGFLSLPHLLFLQIAIQNVGCTTVMIKLGLQTSPPCCVQLVLPGWSVAYLGIDLHGEEETEVGVGGDGV